VPFDDPRDVAECPSFPARVSYLGQHPRASNSILRTLVRRESRACAGIRSWRTARPSRRKSSAPVDARVGWYVVGMALLARDIMQAAVLSVPSDISVADLGDFLISHRIGGVPVVDDAKLAGIVSRSDMSAPRASIARLRASPSRVSSNSSSLPPRRRILSSYCARSSRSPSGRS
jgi:CBS domain-containing protein